MKLGFHCTSGVQVKEYDNHITVSYFTEHYKHHTALCHIPIPESDKEVIAGNFYKLILIN